LGIGMGQNLGYVPVAFVVVAGAVVLLPSLLKLFLPRSRELALFGLILLAAISLSRVLASRAPLPLSQVERGRQVYISEGCINCHSQFVRPNTPDVQMWGPVESIDEVHQQRPPLIGNRRQGPDLAEVGNRRSPLWLKAHFFSPSEVSGSSIMPTYGFLFRDPRGDDLVAYLHSLQGSGTAQRLEAAKSWHPAADALAAASASDGEHLFQRHCATCHSAGGNTRWQATFKRLPPDLSVGPHLDLSPSLPLQQRIDRLAQIAKFGIPGTDMPGHEYLSDQQIASLSLWLSRIVAQPAENR
jgi:cytochrome c oxidase cbb3-type subunit 2